MLCLFVCAFLALSAHGLSHKQQFDDVSHAVFLQSAGLEGDGKIQVKLMNIQVDGQLNDRPRKMGILVKRTQTNYKAFVEDNANVTCLFDVKLEAFENRWIIDPEDTFIRDTTVRVDAPGVYSLYFVNCEPESVVSFKAITRFQNLGRNYLSIGDSPLTMVYAMLVPLYFGGTWLFYSAVYQRWGATSGGKRAVRYLNFFFALQSFCVLGNLIQYNYWKWTGVTETGILTISYQMICEWGVWILIAVLAKNLIEYVRVTSILRHNKILAIALPVQCLSAVILYNLCWESKYQYFREILVFLCVDLISFAFIFHSTKRQSERNESSLPYGKEREFGPRFTLFHVIFVVFSGIIFVSSLGGLLDRYLYFQITWVGPLIVQTCKLALLIFLGFAMKQNVQQGKSSIDDLDSAVQI